MENVYTISVLGALRFSPHFRLSVSWMHEAMVKRIYIAERIQFSVTTFSFTLAAAHRTYDWVLAGYPHTDRCTSYARPSPSASDKDLYGR